MSIVCGLDATPTCDMLWTKGPHQSAGAPADTPHLFPHPCFPPFSPLAFAFVAGCCWQVADIEAAEKNKMKEKCDKIIAHGINCFINRQLIYNYPEEIFADAGGQRQQCGVQLPSLCLGQGVHATHACALRPCPTSIAKQ